MCAGAVMWARLGKVYYANTGQDARSIAFDDDDFAGVGLVRLCPRAYMPVLTPHMHPY